MFEEPDVRVGSRPVGNRKRKRSIEQLNHMILVCDFLPLQQEVLCKQMELFTAQLQLIEEVLPP